jgi:hypothetical protein
MRRACVRRNVRENLFAFPKNFKEKFEDSALATMENLSQILAHEFLVSLIFWRRHLRFKMNKRMNLLFCFTLGPGFLGDFFMYRQMG